MMCWNVFYEGVNTKEIKIWNVFNHASFTEEVKSLPKENKETFSKELKYIVMYYFWSKSEYEVVVASWPPYISRFESNQIKQNELPRYRQAVNLEIGKKFSIYDQLAMNWNIFVNYCWEALPNEKD